MFGSIFGGRRSGAPSGRQSRPSSHASQTSGRASKTSEPEEPTEGSAGTKQPDVEELRQKRQSYYSLSPAQRRQVAAAASSAAKSKRSRTTPSVKSSASKDGVRRRRKHASASGSKSTIRSSKASSRSSGDLVYGTRPNGAEGEEVAEGVERDGQEGQRARTTGSSRHGSKKSVSSKRRSLPTLIETEVTPDDSISQVAERRDAVDDAQSSGSRSHERPSMKRRNTTSSKLNSVKEHPEEHQNSTPVTKRSGKRASLSSSSAPSRRHSTTNVPSPTKLVDCLTCGSDDIPVSKSAELSCGHRMCHDCLKRVFEMSVTDPIHMPPKCCNDDHIPLKHVDKLFDLKFKILWNRKYQEYHTKNRVYCPTPKCGEWIKPKHFHRSSQGRRYALCPRCKTKVCTLCNNKMHKSSDCPKDPEIAKLVEQAKEKGWQRCFSCNAMVELQSGCNHMTCRCTAEFCMICGAQWKTCNCPWFNYSQIPNPDRLNDMRVPEPIRVIYRRVVDAAGGVPPPPPMNRAQEAPAAPPPEVTYQQELDDRRRQERDDAELARRLQLASLWGDEPNERPARRRAPPGDDTWGVGNAAGHFMNEDFVQNAANVVMNAFGDANFGRRGERSSGRRRRTRHHDEQQQGQGQSDGEAGLVPDFLGSESVLGVGPATRRR